MHAPRRSVAFITVLGCGLSFATETFDPTDVEKRIDCTLVYHPYFSQLSQIWETKKWRHAVRIPHF